MIGESVAASQRENLHHPSPTADYFALPSYPILRTGAKMLGSHPTVKSAPVSPYKDNLFLSHTLSEASEDEKGEPLLRLKIYSSLSRIEALAPKSF